MLTASLHDARLPIELATRAAVRRARRRGGPAGRSAGVGSRAGVDADAGDARRGTRCERVGRNRGARASARRTAERRGGGMRIGLIGCGWIAETHLENLKALGEEVACVCDPDPGRLAWATGATGAEALRRLGVAARARASPTPCSCSRRRACTARSPSRRSSAGCPSTSRSPSRAIWTTRGRSSRRSSAPASSARSATSGARSTGCRRRPRRCSPSARSGC